MLFLNVTCYTSSHLSCIHVNTTKLLHITCTLVATSVILWSLECTLFYFYGFPFIPDLLIEWVSFWDSFAIREAKPVGSDHKIDGS